jgi:hypothetical protein
MISLNPEYKLLLILNKEIKILGKLFSFNLLITILLLALLRIGT